jgi:ABC-type Fe3+ transport system permease subunit
VVIAFVCCAMPLAWMAIVVLSNPEVRQQLWLTPFRAQLLGRTLGYNGLAAILATLMGLPAGFMLGRGRGWLARILWVLLPAALLMPSLSYAYGWSQVMRIVQIFCEAHHLRFSIEPAGPIDLLRCIWSLAAWLWAVPAGLIGLALRRMDTNVQQQALLDGALYRITLRQLFGPIIASLAIVTVMASQEFAVYEPSGISVVATEVRMVFDTGFISSPENSIASPVSQGAGEGLPSPKQEKRAAAAVATTAPLLVCTILLAILAMWGTRISSASDSISTGSWPRALDAPRWVLAITLLLLFLNVGVPVWALVGSLHVPFFASHAHELMTIPMPPQIGSIRVSMRFPDSFETFGPEIGGSIFVAVVAASVVLIGAFSAAGKWTTGLLAIGVVSFLIGGQLLAIAMIRIYNHPWLDWAYGAFPVPVIAYVARFGWLAMAASKGTWTPSWKELRDMAAVDGAGTFRTACSIVWPLGWPMLAAGALLVGCLSLTEVPATVLLFPQNPMVLTPRLMTWLHQLRSDDMINAALLMMMAVVVPALAAVVLSGIGMRVTALRAKTRR